MEKCVNHVHCNRTCDTMMRGYREPLIYSSMSRVKLATWSDRAGNPVWCEYHVVRGQAVFPAVFRMLGV